ncbi:hydroxymethylglutaryl-CoA lyase [Bacillus oleivorans]|uniref:Hydroxymethylglutaryl-CoA lyase n=1 Tax=Bacillus oleivorans TaxID=1448271 RepID=A0A285CHM5_9BACI|nr:hydroxymethylglutaryl-CoA lyase [Bacillus oleivorans]SNX67107.1 hydroxymethylglutaryl-CoA lyase [Bacillus oleivorans]
MSQKKVEIVEVGPRDGFQNVPEFIPTDVKLKVIEGIVKSGIKSIQITSFVSPKAIPQMKDAKDVTAACLVRYPDLRLFALVPNLYGAKAAVESGLKELAYVISVSKTHNTKNVKRTHDESFEELDQIVQLYPEIKVTLDVATTFGCPFEGEMSLEEVMAFLQRGYDLGIRTFNLCDTVGLAHPELIKEVVGTVLKTYPDCEFQIHIHDTRNMGMINSFTAIQCGITKVQTAIGGLGGCPFAPGASGNTSTEDFVYMLNKMGYDTGVNFDTLLETATYLKGNVTSGIYSGHQIFIDKTKVSTQ